MKEFEITVAAELIRAAQACQGKKDVRYYLNGFLISTTGDIVGTNGHVLFRGNVPEDSRFYSWVPEDCIVQIDGNIPASASTVTFLWNGETGACKTDNGKMFSFSLVDGTYPNYQRVIPEIPKGVGVSGINFAPKYLAVIPKVFPLEMIAMRFKNVNEPALITPQYDYLGVFNNAELVIMPCRGMEHEVFFALSPPKEEAA